MQSAPVDPAKRPATAARVYDYLLGGVRNFAADREVAEKTLMELPFIRAAAMANRAFLRRAVRHLAAEGIGQFLDIGSGIPTEGNVHEIAQKVSPASRVVYIDLDPLAVAESLEILAGDDRATAVLGDLREPQQILTHPEVRNLLDLGRPVALLLVAVLHFVPDDAQAYGIVAELMRELPPGSYLVATHGATEAFPADALTSEPGQMYQQRTTTGSAKGRTNAEFARFFTGLQPIEPGIVWLSQWRPDPDDAAEFAENPARSGGWAGVGRKV